jgi:uncharacterized membrane protein
MRLRRGFVGCSLAGMASMMPTLLVQTGLLKRLPDPPLPGFDSARVNLSRDAFPFGIPDSSLTLLDFAANLPLATYPDSPESPRPPSIAVFAAGKPSVVALISGWLFYRMPAHERAWCGYCIVAASANFAILALTLADVRRTRAAR